MRQKQPKKLLFQLRYAILIPEGQRNACGDWRSPSRDRHNSKGTNMTNNNLNLDPADFLADAASCEKAPLLREANDEAIDFLARKFTSLMGLINYAANATDEPLEAKFLTNWNRVVILRMLNLADEVLYGTPNPEPNWDLSLSLSLIPTNLDHIAQAVSDPDTGNPPTLELKQNDMGEVELVVHGSKEAEELVYSKLEEMYGNHFRNGM